MLLNLLNEGNSIVNYVQSFFSFSVSNKNIQIQDPKMVPIKIFSPGPTFSKYRTSTI